MNKPPIFLPDTLVDENEAASIQEANQLTSQQEVIETMLGHGLDPLTVSKMTGLNFNTIRAVYQSKSQPKPFADEELAESVRNLIKKAVAQATVIVEVGPDSQRLPLIKALIGSASRMVGSQQPVDESAKMALEKVFVEMRTVNGSTVDIPDFDVVDAEVVEDA